MFLCLSAVSFVLYRVVKRQIAAKFDAFFLSPTPETASAFATLISTIAGVFGSQIAAHLKAVFLGLQSVDAKNERKDIAGAIIGGNSVLGAIVSAFPAVGKKLGRNPALAGLADLVAGKLTKPAAPAEQPAAAPYKFNI